MVDHLSLFRGQVEITVYPLIVERTDAGCPQPKRFRSERRPRAWNLAEPSRVGAGAAPAVAAERFASPAVCFSKAAALRLSAAMSRLWIADAFLRLATSARISRRERREISDLSSEAMFDIL